MEICKTLDRAAPAIKHYHKYPDIILKLSDDFEQPSEWPVMSRGKASERTQAIPTEVSHFNHSEKHHGHLPLKLNTFQASDVILENDQTYEVEVTHTITRQEAQQALQRVLEHLREVERPEISLFNHVTLPRLKVLSVHDKRLVLGWVKEVRPEIFVEWKKKVEEDLEQYQWIEIVKRKLPETQTNHSSGTVWKRFEEWTETHPNSFVTRIEDKVTEHQERHEVGPIFHQKLDQMMMEMRGAHKQQELRWAQLELMWAKLHETCRPTTKDAKVSERAQSPANFSGGMEDQGPLGNRRSSRRTRYPQ